MKRIIVEKTEGIAEVIDRMLASEEAEILFVIPRGSSLAKSASNFRLLKREAGMAQRKIAIESGDTEVVELARMSGIAIGMRGAQSQASAKPIRGGISDIVSKTRDEEDEEDAPEPQGIKLTVRSEDDDSDEEDPKESIDEKDEKKSFLATERFFKPRVIPASRDADDDESEGRGISGKAVGWTIGVIVILGILFYGVTVVFGRAQVSINFTQTPWNTQESVTADTSVATTTMNGSSLVVPGQVFTAQKNITQLFPATGKVSTVSSKAQGTITIYNDYGSASQDLVATTRFMTPSGQIFRITNDVTVPGATVAADGTITPSSVQAPIIADQGGPAYDVGPITKLTIPGFQSNPGKYAGFYGAITGQTTGGATGNEPVPTAGDISSAKASTTAILQADLQDGLVSSYPNNFKILDGATSIQVTKLTVSTTTDANGNFSVFGDATLTAIGFDESALKTYLLGIAQSQSSDSATTLSFKAITLDYAGVQASFSKGQVNFSLSAQGTLEPAFSADQFASQVAGESIGTARDSIQNLPQLSDGKISVWPIWLWAMPSNPNKIQVDVD